MQDLLNLDAGPPSAAPAGPSGGFDALGGLGDAFGSAAPAPTSFFPAVTAFSKDGVSVSFAFSKPPGQPHVTDITATYANSDAAPVSGFSLQVLPTNNILLLAHDAAVLGMLQIVRLCKCRKALASCIMIDSTFARHVAELFITSAIRRDQVHQGAGARACRSVQQPQGV